MYTSHGHHIPFTTLARTQTEAAREPQACGGVRICQQCTLEAANYVPALKKAAQPPYFRRGGDMDFQERAKMLAYQFVREHLEKTDEHVSFSIEDVYIVWFAKALQNWKALVSTTLPDGMYYEVTHNGDEKVTYLDAYKKFQNVTIPDEPIL
jgi:predicted transcriptional regulator of viral defense system